MNNYIDFTINETLVTFYLDTKRHIWRVYFGEIDILTWHDTKPILEFTKAKGEAVIKFLFAIQNKDDE